MAGQTSFFDYEGFVEKFKPKKTTDDCYTPKEVYDEVLAFASERYGFDAACAVRPFYPGGDFERYEYPEGCVVVDNPPFSLLSKIQRVYIERGIPFFLFCQSMTCLGSMELATKVTHIVCDLSVTYENGAVVPTAFITNMGGDVVLEACPELKERVQPICDAYAKRNKKQLPKYTYPDSVLTASRANWMAAHHTPLVIRRSDCCCISKLDAQRGSGKSIFGNGLLLSERAAAERAAAERAAAERAAAERWELSERELAMQAMLGRRDG